MNKQTTIAIMDKKIALDVAIEAVKQQLSEAKDNLNRWKLLNERNPNGRYANHAAQALWQGAVDTYTQTIELLEEMKRGING